MIEPVRLFPDCTCDRPCDSRRWMHHQSCPMYCRACDLDLHRCGGCGEVLAHGERCEPCRLIYS